MKGNMGLLDLLWKSYQSMQEERRCRDDEWSPNYDDEWSPNYDEHNRSSLPPRSARVEWSGYYRDYDGIPRYCSGVSAVVEIGMACRLENNDRGITVQWLRQCIPGYCQPESDNSGAYARIVERNC